jgi:hypothetical protein
VEWGGERRSDTHGDEQDDERRYERDEEFYSHGERRSFLIILDSLLFDEVGGRKMQNDIARIVIYTKASDAYCGTMRAVLTGEGDDESMEATRIAPIPLLPLYGMFQVASPFYGFLRLRS